MGGVRFKKKMIDINTAMVTDSRRPAARFRALLFIG
jgi:hypothetical protein